MVAENCLAQQVNAKVPSLMNQLLVDPQFAMIEVFTAHRIISQEETSANRAIHHMDNGNLIRCKHLKHEPTEPCVTSSSTASGLKQTVEVYKTKSGCQQNAVSPLSSLARLQPHGPAFRCRNSFTSRFSKNITHG